MKIFQNPKELQQFLLSQRESGKHIGFVPTMGALHNGHFTLIKKAKRDNELCVCSIFANPTQFNDPQDLIKYPRTIESDSKGLVEVGCDVLFVPHVEDVYPDGLQLAPEIDLNGLDVLMEGAHRPGHFAGVVQVVKRLLELVHCDKLYMGQKDFQQFTIIKYMIDYFQLSVQLIVVETIREESGLAMSSRNQRLTSEQKEKANIIYRMLLQAKKWINEKPIAEIESKALEFMRIPGFRPEYFKIVDAETLMPIVDIQKSNVVVACTAVWAGEIRLIDNMILAD